LILLILFLFGSTTTQTAVIAQVSNDTAAPGTTTNPEPSPAVPGTTTNPEPSPAVPGTTTNPEQNSTGPHITILTMSSISPIVNVSQSIPVTGSLIDATTGDGINAATIKFDGDGVTNPGSTTTDNHGSFSYNVITPNYVHNGLRIDAGYDGDSSADFIYKSSFKVLTYATVKNPPPVNYPTTLTLNPVPPIVNVSQSIPVTGSLIDTTTGDGINAATIKFDGDGVTNPGSTTTDNHGSFSYHITSPPEIRKALKVQAHYVGDSPPQQLSRAPSDSNIRTYDTVGNNTTPSADSPSITITNVNNSNPNVDTDIVAVSGIATNAHSSSTVTVDWGDGTSMSDGIQLNPDGSWGNDQVTHKYKSADLDNNPKKNIVATLVSGQQNVPNPNDTRVVYIRSPHPIPPPPDDVVGGRPANIPFFWIAPTIAIVMGALGGGLALRKHSKHSKTPSSPVIEPVPESVVNVIAQGGIEDLPNRPVNSSPIPNDSGTNTIVSKEIEVITQGGVER
jgi:hypothetical protein